MDMPEFIKFIHTELVNRMSPEYLGTRLYYSKIIQNPKYLLMGINPGADIFEDYESKHGEKMCNLEEFDKNIDYDYWTRPGLPTSIKNIFFNAGKEGDLENNTMKINAHFQGTKGTEELKKLLQAMTTFCREKLGAHYHDLQSNFILELISEIKPKYIICEGNWAFNNLLEFLRNRHINYDEPDYNKNYGSLLETHFSIDSPHKITAIQLTRSFPSRKIDSDCEHDITEWLKNS